MFTNLILGEIKRFPKPVKVLDIGCGNGIGRQLQPQLRIREAAGEFWGIEPDIAVQPDSGVFDSFQHALMETAELPAASFDLAYSSMVMEHVVKPDAFLEAVCRCLKPGGAYMFLTPNAQSFMPRISKLCHDCRIDEFLLRLIKGSEQVEEYHYPVQYRFNTPVMINGFAEQKGFEPPQFAYIEGSGVRSYFPGPLKMAYHILATKRRLIKNPRRLVTMIGRLTKK